MPKLKSKANLTITYKVFLDGKYVRCVASVGNFYNPKQVRGELDGILNRLVSVINEEEITLVGELIFKDSVTRNTIEFKMTQAFSLPIHTHTITNVISCVCGEIERFANREVRGNYQKLLENISEHRAEQTPQEDEAPQPQAVPPGVLNARQIVYDYASPEASGYTIVPREAVENERLSERLAGRAPNNSIVNRALADAQARLDNVNVGSLTSEALEAARDRLIEERDQLLRDRRLPPVEAVIYGTNERDREFVSPEIFVAGADERERRGRTVEAEWDNLSFERGNVLNEQDSESNR